MYKDHSLAFLCLRFLSHTVKIGGVERLGTKLHRPLNLYMQTPESTSDVNRAYVYLCIMGTVIVIMYHAGIHGYHMSILHPRLRGNILIYS